MSKAVRNNKNSRKNRKPSIRKQKLQPRTDLSTRQMKIVLIKKFGLICWGCDFIAPREQYLQMDHIDPKSSGGSNDLDNRALLCAPCNSLKSNTKTLVGLRLENLKKGFSKKDPHPIDIITARKWCKQYIQGIVNI